MPTTGCRRSRARRSLPSPADGRGHRPPDDCDPGAYAVWNRRLPTSALNRWFEQAIQANPPPAVSGRRLKLNYITQVKARPPSFVLFCSRADAIPRSYLRYLINSLRETFDLPGTPIRITLREKANPFAHKRKRPS